jgi:uncharacterized protein (TIGR02231 family)
MYKLSVLIITLFYGIGLFGQTFVDSKISDVTVYRQNAKIISKAQSNLKAGTSEIIIENISTSIIPSSLQVNLSSKGKVTLLSAKYETNYMQSPKKNPRLVQLQDSLEIINTELHWVRDQKDTYAGMESVLNSNKSLANNNGFTASEVSALIENYKNQLLAIRKKNASLSREEKKLNIKKQQLQNQLNEVSTKLNAPSGQIVLQISALQPSTADFKLTYIVRNAGWSPIYDLRAESISEPIELSYKANIYQNTGFDWERVNLSVSTGNPTQNNNRPILNTQFIDFRKPAMLESVAVSRSKSNLAYEALEDMEQAPMDDAFAYDAVVVENQLNVDFNLSLPQSIPSDGRQHLVALDQHNLDAKYVYHTVPKLDKGAFLLAKVSNWGHLNLLPGNANIFFEGTYVGETYINPTVAKDTLLLSMGRDEKIIISRNSVKDFTGTKLLGSNKTQTFKYEIELKNNKHSSIEIEVLDQIPISKNKDIQVKLEESGDATYTESNGKLLWNVKLAKGETKKLTFTFSVKYPKDEIIFGL